MAFPFQRFCAQIHGSELLHGEVDVFGEERFRRWFASA
jgi:hypothetical protein